VGSTVDDRGCADPGREVGAQEGDERVAGGVVARNWNGDDETEKAELEG
jgi:hypothetical protein